MRRTIALICFIFLVSPLGRTEEKRASMEVGGIFGYNETWKGYGGVELKGVVPLGKCLSVKPGIEYLGPKVFSTTVVLRPSFKIWKGTAFVDGSFNYRNYKLYKTGDLALSLSAGYDLEYIAVQVGIMGHSFHSCGDKVSEPLNLLYCGELRLRRSDSSWNVSAGAANFTDFEYERTWEPLYFLKGRLDLSEKLSLVIRGDLKPSGIFHMDAQFWGISGRAGLKYRF